MIWVAELGSMHKGDKSLAFELIRQAKESGATIAKFQFGWTREAQVAQGKEYLATRYVDEWADDLKKWCNYFGIELMASLWSLDGLEVARRIGMKRYKIAYQKRNDEDLITRALVDGKEMFVSGLNEPTFHSIYCVSEYPTYPNRLTMPKQFGDYPDWYGYSDHCHGISACLLAVARGAKYVEAHFALGKDDLVVRDTPFSKTPEEFEELTRLGSDIERLLNVQV